MVETEIEAQGMSEEGREAGHEPLGSPAEARRDILHSGNLRVAQEVAKGTNLGQASPGDQQDDHQQLRSQDPNPKFDGRHCTGYYLLGFFVSTLHLVLIFELFEINFIFSVP